MSAKSVKWIEGLEATTALDVAARRVLTVRLDAVKQHLPRALRWPTEKFEAIHQLRVGTRRARAAIDTFALCLRSKASRRIRKILRKIRRGAGDARDWDVFLISVTEFAEKKTARFKPGLDFLTGYACHQREAAQGEFEAVPAELDTMVDNTLKAVRKPKIRTMETLLDLAQMRLIELVEDLQKAASRNLSNFTQLHRVRIAGKRLRYAMEIFGGCFPPVFRDQMYPKIEEMQEILGNANDSHFACERLAGIRQQLKARRREDRQRLEYGIDRFQRFQEQRLTRGRQRFLKWWQRWQKTDGRDGLQALVLGPR